MAAAKPKMDLFQKILIGAGMLVVSGAGLGYALSKKGSPAPGAAASAGATVGGLIGGPPGALVGGAIGLVGGLAVAGGSDEDEPEEIESEELDIDPIAIRRQELEQARHAEAMAKLDKQAARQGATAARQQSVAAKKQAAAASRQTKASSALLKQEQIIAQREEGVVPEKKRFGLGRARSGGMAYAETGRIVIGHLG